MTLDSPTIFFLMVLLSRRWLRSKGDSSSEDRQTIAEESISMHAWRRQRLMRVCMRNARIKMDIYITEPSSNPRSGHARRVHLLPMALIIEPLKCSDILGMYLPTSAQQTLGLGPERQKEKLVL